MKTTKLLIATIIIFTTSILSAQQNLHEGECYPNCGHIYDIANDTLAKDTNTIIWKQNNYDPLSPPNTYQNIDNPNYWKNKMPHKAYWQHDCILVYTPI